MERISSLSKTTLPSGAHADYRKAWKFFLAVVVIHIAAGLLYEHAVLTDDVYHEVFAGRFEPDRIAEAVTTIRKLSVVGYLALPLLLGVRVAVVALLLQFGFLLMWVELPFWRLFRVLTVASLTGAAMVCTKTWIHLVSPPYELSASTLVIPPISLASLVGVDSYSPAALVVLQSTNVFELCWLMLVCHGIRRMAPMPWSDVSFVVLAVWSVILLVQAALVQVFSGGLV